PERRRQGVRQGGLADARQVLDEQVSPREDAGQGEADLGLFPDDDLADLAGHRLDFLEHSGDIPRESRQWCHEWGPLPHGWVRAALVADGRRPGAAGRRPSAPPRRPSAKESKMSAMNEIEAPLVDVRREGEVLTLTMNRPAQFNALSEALMDALEAELREAGSDESLRVVVIGANGKAFCAGHDLREMRAEPGLDYYRTLFARCSQLMMTIQRLPQPVIARVQGVATAAGCQLVAMCDLAVAADTARFAVSGVNLGLFCSTPSVALSRNVPRKQAFEMLVTGEFIDAATALQRGLVNRV